MKHAIEHLLETRKNIIKVLTSFKDQAHIIPKGYSNNLFWNAAHCIVTQQLLCYKLSGLEMKYDDAFIEKYRKGSSAYSENISDSEWNFVIEELINSVHVMKADFEKGIFQNFIEYPTSYGVTLRSSEQAIEFNNSHEALHLGYMMAMRKAF